MFIEMNIQMISYMHKVHWDGRMVQPVCTLERVSYLVKVDLRKETVLKYFK